MKENNGGNKYIQKLSSDLREYGKGYSVRNLHYMIQFSETFTNNEIVQLPVAQISWRSLITIMTKCKNHEEQLWYVSASKKYGWGKELLLNQIAMKAYERSLINPTTTEAINNSLDLTNELFKDTYVFDFLDKEKIKTEKDLKNQMMDNIIKFLQELGPEFS